MPDLPRHQDRHRNLPMSEHQKRQPHRNVRAPHQEEDSGIRQMSEIIISLAERGRKNFPVEMVVLVVKVGLVVLVG